MKGMAKIRTGDTTKCTHRLLVLVRIGKHKKHYECQYCGHVVKVEP